MLEGSVPAQVLTCPSLCPYFSLSLSLLAACTTCACSKEGGRREKREREGGGRERMEEGGSVEGGTGEGGEGQVEYRLACTIIA